MLLYDARRGARGRVHRQLPDLSHYSDADFYQRFRFDKCSVQYLTEEFCTGLESDTNNHPISTETKMLVTLRFLASNSLQQVIGDTFGMSKGVVNGIIWEVIPRIAGRMNDFIQMPTGDKEAKNFQAFYDLTGIPGVVGALDCTHVKVNVGREREGCFLNRKGYTSNNIQAVCDAKYRFISVYAFWPGCTHDSFVLQQSSLYRKFEENTIAGVLLGDSGYGNGKPWLLTPLGDPQSQPERSYNYAQKRGRVLIEQTFGQVKRRFRGMLDGFRTSPEKANMATVAACVLHNIAKDRGQPDNFTEDEDSEDERVPEPYRQREADILDNQGFQDGRRFREHVIQTCFGN